jgi:hypothetical protein
MTTSDMLYSTVMSPGSRRKRPIMRPVVAAPQTGLSGTRVACVASVPRLRRSLVSTRVGRRARGC